jgi:PAP2 superfamily
MTTTTHELAGELERHDVRLVQGGSRPGPPPRWRVAARELVLVATAALLYSLVRGLTDDRTEAAFANAERVIDFERRLGIFVEPDLQRWALGSDLIVDLANAVYIAYWPIIIGTLVWLLVTRPMVYPLFRSALLASGAVSLAVFALYPLAPPRFLPEYGFADTIAAHSDGYRDFNASALVNEYAAMPSLHFGWVLLASIAIGSVARTRWLRVGAATMPVLMLASIVLTGNHYLVDALVGGAVVLAGLGIALVLRDRLPTQAALRSPPHPARQ